MNINIKNQLVSRVAKVIRFIEQNPNTNIKNISNELKIDYNFVSKIIQKCNEEKLLKVTVVAREKQIELIKKGLKLAEAIEQIEKIIK